jgi:predicted enzyme related to lactoylglutathione lyase
MEFPMMRGMNDRDRNPVGWFEIYVQDMGRARSFYEAVLGYTLENLTSPVPGMEMWAFPGGPDRPGACGALVSMPGKDPGAGGTIVYFSCHDCGVEEARVPVAGGRVHLPKMPIGQYGFISLVVDPEGNMFGLHSMV